MLRRKFSTVVRNGCETGKRKVGNGCSKSYNHDRGLTWIGRMLKQSAKQLRRVQRMLSRVRSRYSLDLEGVAAKR
jgi:hypothetical protein